MGESSEALGAPVLETPRTVMRPHRLADFEALAAMWADPEVVRFITGKPSSREESWSRLNRYAGHWCLMGFGFWAVEEKETGRYLGEVGFADFKRDIQPTLEGMPEAGWVLATAAHGRGIATETVTAALSWGDAHFAQDNTVCIIAPAHAASLRVAEKQGFREYANTIYLDQPTLLFRRPRFGDPKP